MSTYSGEGNLVKDLTRTTSVASPGFAFGSQGTISNSYLIFNNVPSNMTGAPNYLENSFLLSYVIATSQAGTYTLEIYEHDTTTFTLLDSLSVTTSSFEEKVLTSPIALTTGKRLAVKIGSNAPNSAKDPIVYLIIRGDQIG